MGITWCRVDPKFEVGGETYHAVIGISGEARDHLGDVGISVRATNIDDAKAFGHHKLLGADIVFEFYLEQIDDDRTLEVLLYADTGEHQYPCSIEIRRGTPNGELILAGAGLTSSWIEAGPISNE